MSWIEPKTTWNGRDNEYFDIDIDYPRIKENILHLQNLFDTVFFDNSSAYYQMGNYSYNSIPYVDFFNNIVYNIDTIKNGLNKVNVDVKDYNYLRTYYENQSIWDYNDLNKIEQNISILKKQMEKYEKAKRKLPIKLGIRSVF